MTPLRILATEGKIEYTINLPGSTLFLQFTVVSSGEVEPAICYMTTYYHDRTFYTPRKDDGWYTDCHTAHKDFLDSLMLGGEQALYRAMEAMYNTILNNLEGKV